ncbi:tyrosine-type recombinase/integrase [Eggerthellaceae bacterium zg-997]|nr:tyrosine-type recombinase/integrase [Eggerthellaceae bacterium zg-997]
MNSVNATSAPGAQRRAPSKSRFGHIQRIGQDHYRVFWRESGKTRSKQLYGSLDDAERLLASKRLGAAPPSPSMRLERYWDSVVLPSCDGLATRTRQGYGDLWGRLVRPCLGRCAVSSIGRADVQRCIDAVSSPETQRAVFRLIRKIMNRAVSDGLADRNPCDRYIELRPQRRRPKRLLAAAEVVPWLRSIDSSKYAPVMVAALGAGLRVEEACALDWEDVRFAERGGRAYCAIRVSKAIVTVRGGSEMKEPKTALSRRVAVMGEPFASALRRHAASGPLCRRADGGRTQPATVTRNFRLWCESNGVDYIQPRNLRSTFATLHGEAGSPDSLVSLAMGHSDGTTRGTHYQASTEAGLVAIADSLTRYLDGSVTDDVTPMFDFTR